MKAIAPGNEIAIDAMGNAVLLVGQIGRVAIEAMRMLIAADKQKENKE